MRHMVVEPVRIEFRIFTLKNTIFTLNLHIFCRSSFFRLHMWNVWRNIKSSFPNLVKNCVFTFVTLTKSNLQSSRQPSKGPSICSNTLRLLKLFVIDFSTYALMSFPIALKISVCFHPYMYSS